MCGICGYTGTDHNLVQRMKDQLIHRGPDGEGTVQLEGVTFGHRRLSIIDTTDSGTQPMQLDGLMITYNGELYNYQSLKKELQSVGHNFVSNSDTEVILHAWQEWGIKALDRFNGMWAFAIYDQEQGKIYMCRDRFGIKPLYYSTAENQLAFASEIKAVLPALGSTTIDLEGVNAYFYQKYLGADLSLYQQVRKLMPGQLGIYNLDQRNLTFHQYYDVDSEVRKAQDLSQEERSALLQTALQQAVESRLVADVEVGTFLSGGLDSSLVAGLVDRAPGSFKSFSVGFEQASFNELEFSTKVARHLQTDHITTEVTCDDDFLERLVVHLNEPFGDSSIVPTSLLSGMTAKHVKVALSGDGADELFGGYDTYMGWAVANAIPKPAGPLIKAMAKATRPSDEKVTLGFKLRRFSRDMDKPALQRHMDWMATFPAQPREDLLGQFYKEIPAVEGDGSLRAVQLTDVHGYLPENILRKVDLASMMNALEVRVPFLDHRVVPLALTLPDDQKLAVRKGGKLWLKNFAASYLPKEIIHRKKRGFTAPVSHWIKQSEFIKELLLGDHYQHQLYTRETVSELYKQHQSGEKDLARELWLLFIFQAWFNKHQGSGSK